MELILLKVILYYILELTVNGCFEWQQKPIQPPKGFLDKLNGDFVDDVTPSIVFYVW